MVGVDISGLGRYWVGAIMVGWGSYQMVVGVDIGVTNNTAQSVEACCCCHSPSLGTSADIGLGISSQWGGLGGGHIRSAARRQGLVSGEICDGVVEGGQFQSPAARQGLVRGRYVMG